MPPRTKENKKSLQSAKNSHLQLKWKAFVAALEKIDTDEYAFLCALSDLYSELVFQHHVQFKNVPSAETLLPLYSQLYEANKRKFPLLNIKTQQRILALSCSFATYPEQHAFNDQANHAAFLSHILSNLTPEIPDNLKTKKIKEPQEINLLPAENFYRKFDLARSNRWLKLNIERIKPNGTSSEPDVKRGFFKNLVKKIANSSLVKIGVRLIAKIFTRKKAVSRN